MKQHRKKKIDLLQGILSGTQSVNTLLDKPLAKIYLEDVDEPGIYKTGEGKLITKAEMDKECRHYTQIIVQLVTKGIPPIAESEEEVAL